MTERELLESIGAKIKGVRKQKGMSQMELGAKARLHHSSVSQIEHGNEGCLIATLKRIADVLEKDIKYFL
jgi:transcriptional regulator with XRE-family HTH domain